MLTTRVIPCLLLQNAGLVKTVKFTDPTYIGDPINAVKIFNDKEVDELIFLDINATKDTRQPLLKVIEEIANECFMPFCYGGGVRDIETIKKLFRLGAEKVSINSYAIEHPDFIRKAADMFGSQSIVVSIDVRKMFWGKHEVFTHSGTRKANLNPVAFAVNMENMGAGELLINSIDRDGTMQGYDLALLQRITEAVNIPVIACGGAGTLDHLAEAVNTGGASAVAAGSMFVYYGKHKAVLINYPERKKLEQLFHE